MAERETKRGTVDPQGVKNGAAGGQPNDAKRPKTTKVLPTDRIQMPKQFEIIRAFGSLAGGMEGKPVRSADVAGMVKLNPSTVALATPFLTSIGILQRNDAGLVPSPEVHQFTRAYEWNPETAAQKIAPIIERSWFMQAILPRLRFNGSMAKKEAIEILGLEASAGLHHKGQVHTLLEYAAGVGLIQLDGELIKIIRPVQDGATQPLPTAQAVAEPASSQAPAVDRARSPLAAALFPSNAEGTVQFHISVKVNMAEVGTWQPDRIAAFFSGIAQVLAARGKVEAMMGGDNE